MIGKIRFEPFELGAFLPVFLDEDVLVEGRNRPQCHDRRAIAVSARVLILELVEEAWRVGTGLFNDSIASAGEGIDVADLEALVGEDFRVGRKVFPHLSEFLLRPIAAEILDPS